MATKETSTGQRARWKWKPGGRTRLWEYTRLLEGGICFLLGGVMAGAQVFGAYAPFGVALVGAAGSGIGGLCALLGTCLGYLFLQGLVQSLRYAAAAVLVYAAAMAFWETSLRRKAWFMPAVTSLLCAATGFVVMVGTGWGAGRLAYYLSELVLTGVATYFFHLALMGWKGEETGTADSQAGLLALGATVLVALSGITVAQLSLGHMIGALLVMLLSRRGVAFGVMSGVGVGVALDMASGMAPYFSMVYPVAGLLMGLCRNRGKLPAILAYIGGNAMVVFWTWNTGMRVELLYEVFVASVVFMVLPQRVRQAAGQMLAVRKTRSTDWERTRRAVVEHMRATAKAFRDLYETIRENFRQAETNESQDVAVVFQCTSERLCRHCALRDSCWQREYQNTTNALNDVSQPMLKRGRLQADDFPVYFSSRCIHFPEFIQIANEELTAFLYRRQYQSKVKENRAALCRQYAELDRILDQAATELGAELTPDLPREAKLRSFLRASGVADTASVYYDEKGRVRVETPDHPALQTEEGRQRLVKLLGMELHAPESAGKGRLLFRQAEPFLATASVAGKSRAGESISGDTGTWFRREDGVLCILLCDGMGSGPAARAESGQAVRLLQNFLRAGVDPEAALCTVNSALALKGEETGVCTTIDLLTIELFTGLCSVYKFGAAPTYVRKKNKVSCITGNALPAGVVSGEFVKPDMTRFRAEEGDWIVLLTDGVTGAGSDMFLREHLASYEGLSPGELADQLMAASAEAGGVTDDQTIIVVRLEKRK